MQKMRTALFVPATQIERIDKALASGADEVIVDLEDAVAEDLKDSARTHLQHWLEAALKPVFVRVNGVGHAAHRADVALCRAAPMVGGVVLPKVERGADIAALELADKRIWPIIETAQALACLDDIAGAKHVERLAAGYLDLAMDMGWNFGTSTTGKMLDQVRFQLVLQSRLHGLEPPIDGVFPALDNEKGLRKAATKARDSGFCGMLAIHPRQIETIHKVFVPRDEDIVWAGRVIDEAKNHAGAFALDGAMIDAPVIAKARRILALLEQPESKPKKKQR